PWQAAPPWQVRVCAESAGLPGLDHAAQGPARIAMQVYEPCLREYLRQERDAQRVLGRFFEHPDRSLIWCLAVPVTKFGQETATQCFNNLRRRRRGIKPVGIVTSIDRAEAGRAFDHRMTFAADGVKPRRLLQSLEQQGRTGPWWRDDEYRAVVHGVAATFGRMRRRNRGGDILAQLVAAGGTLAVRNRHRQHHEPQR